MGVREEQKRRTRTRIIHAAARRLSERGLAGVGVSEIMSEAGLTHGGFYVHFESRRELVSHALGQAAEGTRRWFLRGLSQHGGLDWVRAATRRYLTPRHRDNPATGCAIAGLAADVAREDAPLREAFEHELKTLLGAFGERLESEGDDSEERAMALVALCAGGITLSRAVADRALSDRILAACQALAERDLAPLGSSHPASPVAQVSTPQRPDGRGGKRG